MKIVAFAASSSRQSINKQLVTAAGNLLRQEFVPSAEIEVLDLNDYEMPIYSIDRETENGIPDAAQRFFRTIGDADALLISYAEHNGSYTAAFKNLFDWASRIDRKVYQGKPAVMLATSPGKGGAGNVLRMAETSAPHFGAVVRGTFALAGFHEKFDIESQRPRDPADLVELRRAIADLAENLLGSGGGGSR